MEEHRLRSLVSSLPVSLLSCALRSYVNSAVLASEAGFKVIQIHAAHGYLLSLMLNPLTNCRSDEFRLDGPWLTTFFENLLNAAKHRIISVRLSIFSGLRDESGAERECTLQISKHLASLGVQILDYSVGFYTVNKRLIYPSAEEGALPSYSFVRALANEVKAVLSCVGNVHDLRELPPLGENMAVSVGRALIADPQFASKSRAGLFTEITRCQFIGHCHYFSRGRRTIECGVNPHIARKP
jgi:2,4-dienoyl-CoA reductase-like NADH-dependent reductase (Old Yellow Enzyme family)